MKNRIAGGRVAKALGKAVEGGFGFGSEDSVAAPGGEVSRGAGVADKFAAIVGVPFGTCDMDDIVGITNGVILPLVRRQNSGRSGQQGIKRTYRPGVAQSSERS